MEYFVFLYLIRDKDRYRDLLLEPTSSLDVALSNVAFGSNAKLSRNEQLKQIWDPRGNLKIRSGVNRQILRVLMLLPGET
jgi:hypothetical protein